MTALRLVIEVIKRQFPKVPVMTTNELHQLMRTTTPAPRKLVLLDTREEKEFKVSHLAKAILLNPEETDMSRVIDMIHQKVGPPHEPKTVVCYCAVGYRASIMANRLIDELQKPENQELKSDMDVYNLEGSIFKWANERKDLVEPSGQSTTLVNTVSPFWGLLVYKKMRARVD